MHNYIRAMDTCHIVVCITIIDRAVETLTKLINSSVWCKSKVCISVYTLYLIQPTSSNFLMYSLRCGWPLYTSEVLMRLAYVSQISCNPQTPGLITHQFGGFSVEFLRGFPLSVVPVLLINIPNVQWMFDICRAFIEAQKVPGCIVHLGDRPIGITLKRALSGPEYFS